MESTQEQRDARVNRWSWVVVGLAATGVGTVVRALVLRAANLRHLDESFSDPTIVNWNAAASLSGALPVVLLCGLALGWLVTRSTRTLLAGRALVGAALWLLAVAGIGSSSRTRAYLHRDFAFDDLMLLIPLALLMAGICVGAGRRARPYTLRSVAWALGLGVLLPLGVSVAIGYRAPTFERRLAVLDLLARSDLWTIIERHPDRGPEVIVFTPAVMQHADSADKPSLWMPPPCRVEMRIPEGTPPGVLRVSAGIDRRLRDHLTNDIPQVTFDARIELNGKTVSDLRLRNEPLKPGVWPPPDWVWQHAGGERGILVEPGDVLTFDMRIPDGEPASKLPADSLRVGFGGLFVEARLETRRARSSPTTPNLVLIVMDTLRADHLSCYGYEKETTPHIDRLAARGMRFEAAHSTSSWTWPSTASILTGLSADAHGVLSNEACTLNLALTSLPEVLQRRGYTTAGFSGNPLITPVRYFDQGFEHFDSSVPDFRMSDELVPPALAWLDAHAGARFFLYLHLVDPHTPHRPHPDELERLGGTRPAEFPGLDLYSGQRLRAQRETGELPPVPEEVGDWVRDVYDASVATGDRWVGKVLQRLEDLGVADETIVVFTSDHGEELLDRDRIGHGHGIHGELVQVPLILAGPGIPAGVTNTTAVSNRHVATTLALFAGAELVGMGDGFSLLRAGGEGTVVFQTSKAHVEGRGYQELDGLRDGSLVLHWWRGKDRERLWLYDAQMDPGQSQDLAAQRPEQAASLREALRTRLDAQREWAPAHKVGVGAGGMETLYNIGYAGNSEE